MQAPNYTQIPNVIFDDLMKSWTGAQLKVFLAICRKTIGWHKTCDGISYSQLKEMTGLESAACAAALKTLVDAGLLIIEREMGKTSRIELALTSSESEEVSLRKAKSTSSESEETKETPQKKVKLTLASTPAKVQKEKLIRKITDYYQELFAEEYDGAKPTWDGKIIKLVKADIARLGDARLGRLIQIFFEDPTSFVRQNGTGMGYNIFHSQIDCLLEKERRGA